MEKKDGIMKAHINPSLVKNIIGILVLLLLIKLLWFIIEVVWFPAKGVDHAEGKQAKPLYYRIKLTPNKSAAPKITKPKPAEGHIRDIKLLAVYHASDTTVVTVQYKGKAKVLAKGEAVNGFELEDAGSKFAIFGKNGKQYRVTLVSSKKGSATYTSIPSSSKEVKQDSGSGDTVDMDGVVDAGDHKIIDRSLIEHYTKDMKSIYKDIGIQEIKKGKKIDGFRVTFVKRGTPFAKLGLQKGDILKTINGQVLDSYNAAFEAYKNINDATNVTLTIQRGKKEMELEYEIN
jgi:general secretion pathway protein C